MCGLMAAQEAYEYTNVIDGLDLSNFRSSEAFYVTRNLKVYSRKKITRNTNLLVTKADFAPMTSLMTSYIPILGNPFIFGFMRKTKSNFDL